MKRNNNYPKVSIITCVYNGENYISKLLDSVLNMGYPNIEHIIVNDGSTDGTENIVADYSIRYKNKENSNLYIKYIKQENMGLGSATNTGLKQITGDYWTWINCDDWYEPKAFFEPIERLLRRPKLNYILMNGFNFFGMTKHKTVIVKKRLNFYKHKKMAYIEYCRGERYYWLLFLCRTSSYKKINSGMSIYQSRYTQDEQFYIQLSSSLNGDISINPKWNFYLRESSYSHIVSTQLSKDIDVIRVKSIEQLNIPEDEKSTLLNVYYEERLLLKFKRACRFYHSKQAKALLMELIALRKKIPLSWRLKMDKKIYLYYLFSFFGVEK